MEVRACTWMDNEDASMDNKHLPKGCAGDIRKVSEDVWRAWAWEYILQYLTTWNKVKELDVWFWGHAQRLEGNISGLQADTKILRGIQGYWRPLEKLCEDLRYKCKGTFYDMRTRVLVTRIYRRDMKAIQHRHTSTKPYDVLQILLICPFSP